MLCAQGRKPMTGISKESKDVRRFTMRTMPPGTAKTKVSEDDGNIDGQIKDLANALGRAEAAIDTLRKVSERGRHRIRKQGRAA